MDDSNNIRSPTLDQGLGSTLKIRGKKDTELLPGLLKLSPAP